MAPYLMLSVTVRSPLMGSFACVPKLLARKQRLCIMILKLLVLMPRSPSPFATWYCQQFPVFLSCLFLPPARKFQLGKLLEHCASFSVIELKVVSDFLHICTISVLVQHFYAEPRAASTKLGWESKTNLQEDLKARYEEYIAIGRDKKDIKFELDDKILKSLLTPVSV